MAPFGLKLWENAFQTIPNISFVDAEQIFLAKIFDENFRQNKKSSENRQTASVFLRSYGFLDVIGRCASKSYPQSLDFQLSTTCGGGVKEIVSFCPRLSTKNDFTPFGFLARRRICVGQTSGQSDQGSKSMS